MRQTVANKVSTFIPVLASWCLVFVVALLFPSAVKADDKPTKTDNLPLYPLKKGMKWETVDGKGERRIVEVTDIVPINKLVCYQITGDGRQRYIAVKEDGIYEVNQLITLHPHPLPKGYIFPKPSFSEPFCILKLPSDKVQSLGEGVIQYSDSIKHNGIMVAATLVISESASFKQSTWYLPGKGMIKKQTWQRINVDDKWTLLSEYVTVTLLGDSSLKIGDVFINKAEVDKEASSESVEAPQGVVTEFKKSRTISREASFTTKIGLGADAETKIEGSLLVVKGELALKIRASLEKELGEKLTDSETREQTVKIDGNVIQKAKIVWIDTYRTGTVEVTEDGKTYKIPFQFPVGTKLVVRKQ